MNGWSLRRLVAAGLLGACIAPPGAALAQDESLGSPRGSNISGSIEVDGGGSPPDRYEVIVQKITGAGNRRIISEPGGRFYVPGVLPGTYTLTIRPPETSPFVESSTEVTIISGNSSTNYFVTIFLKFRDRGALTRAPGGRVFSAQESDAAVPKTARKEYQAGVKASRDNKPTDAIQHFRAALRIAPAYLFALNDLGVLLTRVGKYADSADVLRRAIEIAPKSFPPHLNLAIALLALENVDEASSEVKYALELNPAAHDALYLSGTIERRKGNAEAAIELFHKSYDAGGVDAILAQFELGQLYDSLGQKPAAARAYRTFLQFVHSGPQADVARKRLESLDSGA